MMSVALRSAIYALLQIIVTPVYAIVSLLTFPLPPLVRYRIITSWSHLMIWAAERVCGIRYRVLGRENIPTEPCIVLAKHESAWETLALQVMLPPQVWVVKRELLWIPFFGWGLAMLSPIAIDRSEGTRSLRQMLVQARTRLKRGFWIIIFPEGTRSAPGARGTYHAGGAWLAAHTGALVLPVAHNAGDHWPKNSFAKYPGVITLSFGPPLRPSPGIKPAELMNRVEQWIEAEMLRIRAA